MRGMPLTNPIVAPAPPGAPKLEPALSIHIATQIAHTSTEEGPVYHGPSIDEFFPDTLFNAFGVIPVNRIHLIQILATVVLIALFWLGTRRMRVVPGRFQSLIEMGLDFVRVNIAHDLLGRKDGDRFLPIL